MPPVVASTGVQASGCGPVPAASQPRRRALSTPPPPETRPAHIGCDHRKAAVWGYGIGMLHRVLVEVLCGGTG